MKIELGSILQDNDARGAGRTLVVVDFTIGGIKARSEVTGRLVSILNRRIHLDGKSRKYEFNLTGRKSMRPIIA